MFDRIRPYRDDEIPAAMERMASDKFLPTVCSYLFPDKTLEEVAAGLRSCRTVRDFQSSFGYDVVWAIVLKTIDKLTISGLEELPDDRKYLFVANHRDIVLDAAILQDLLMNIGRDTTEITFGANLMEGQFVIDFGKSNKMFRVERPDTVASPRDGLSVYGMRSTARRIRRFRLTLSRLVSLRSLHPRSCLRAPTWVMLRLRAMCVRTPPVPTSSRWPFWTMTRVRCGSSRGVA